MPRPSPPRSDKLAVAMSDLTRRFVQTTRVAALQAGAVARRLQGQVANRGKRTSSGTPESEALTAADLAAQDVILHLLADAFPGIRIDAEEDTDTVELFGSDPDTRLEIVVDPIDGTLGYVEGSEDFAVMAALIDGGRLAAAVVAYPALARLFWAIAGEGCFAQPAGEQPRHVVLHDAPSRVLVTPRTPPAWLSALAAGGYEVEPCRCSAVSSAAPVLGRGCSVYHGRADRRRTIPLLLTHEAGGVVLAGDRRWTGEDPRSLSEYLVATVAAATEDEASRLLAIVRDA